MKQIHTTCPHCHGRVGQKRLSPTGAAQLGALLALLLGLALIVFAPCVGWIVGPIIVLAAIIADGKRRKVLCCKQCNAIIAEVG